MPRLFQDRDIPLGGALTLRNAFYFPLQNPQSRRELLIGALLFIIPPLGWIMNMGYRMNVVHHHHQGRPLWPAWQDPLLLFRNGCVGALAFLVYMGPGAALAAVAAWHGLWLAALAGTMLAAAGAFLIPGFMTFYCVNFDIAEIFALRSALARIRARWRLYLHAWGIVLLSASISFLGLPFFVVGFFVTTTWNWQVAAYCFCGVFAGDAHDQSRAA